MDAAILRQQQQLQQEQLQIQQQQLQQQQSVIQQQQQQAETQQRTAAATAATADHGGDILAEICLSAKLISLQKKLNMGNQQAQKSTSFELLV